MQLCGLKDVLEKESDPHRNTHFNEPARPTVVTQHESNYPDV